MAGVIVLCRDNWLPRATAHREAVQALTAERRERKSRGQKHPVDDFLFEYYRYRPNDLARWHPGLGVALEQAPEHAAWRGYITADGVTSLDVDDFLDRRGATVDFIRALLASTMQRAATFNCFGLHEWAMVYQLRQGEVRHEDWPLRLGSAGTDAVVEDHQISCSHYDAYRFFTPPAAPRNQLSPQRDTMPAIEQSGCLHAGMDIYKWCFKLAPLVPSDLTLDAFYLAQRIRTVDMRAAPYDLTTLGYDPITIETTQGKAEYVAAQRQFTHEGNVLRQRLLNVLRAPELDPSSQHGQTPRVSSLPLPAPIPPRG